MLNVILALLFVQRYDVKGLAMAQSVVATFEAVLLYKMLKRKIGPLLSFKSFISAAKIVFAGSFAMLVAYLLLRYVFPLLSGETGFFTLAPKFFAIASLSAATYILVGWWIRQPEAELVVKKISRFIFKRQQLS